MARVVQEEMRNHRQAPTRNLYLRRMAKEGDRPFASVLAQYQNALNQSNTDAVMELYSSDGVFMSQHFPSSVGADAVRKAVSRELVLLYWSIGRDLSERFKRGGVGNW
jgi:hypothetical protein